ncbi:hypothetical protein [Bifidobacterium pseudolongum]|uniref:PhnA protein n=1 Tax=Bifidobacterium pseudolongum subsp. globosum TaxID=1690 RepID=A0A4Q5ARY2_9BIFI|nr:hypothetical protein [Bifidobacterium pseudolongum]RYQ36304.1 hypothetical protein PG2003B_1141 [Bifidobacterium pseudolongum subsp. globosum]
MATTASPEPGRIKTDIHHLKEQTIEIAALADRRIRIIPQDASGAHVQATSAPALINLPATDLLTQVRALCMVLAQAAGLHTAPSMTALDLLAGLDRDQYAARLEEREDAWQIVRLIAEASESCERLLDPSPATMLAGSCPWCAAGVWLPDKEESRQLAWYRCESCGRIVDLGVVRQAQRMRLLASGYVGTASKLAATLCKCGYGAKRKTIEKWRQRGKLKSVGTSRGVAVYRLGDVLRLLQN